MSGQEIRGASRSEYGVEGYKWTKALRGATYLPQAALKTGGAGELLVLPCCTSGHLQWAN